MKAVVGAAVLRDGRVLAARRTAPPTAAGRWELPGGKVEPGETQADAVVREVAEELGCTVEVTGWLAGRATIDETHVLTVALARLVTGEPAPREHDRLRWLGPHELDTVDWLEPDRPFLAGLGSVLRAARSGGVGPVRGIFFEEEDARAVVARLRSDGFAAEVSRERLAGEDDDEDHPWAVLTDAPAPVLELLVEERDGWLDLEPGAGALPGPLPGPLPVPPPAPLDLPSAPRRVKRP